MNKFRLILVVASLVIVAGLILGVAVPAARAAGCNAPGFICQNNYGHFPTSACYQMAQAYNQSNPSHFWSCWDTGDGQAYLFHW